MLVHLPRFRTTSGDGNGCILGSYLVNPALILCANSNLLGGPISISNVRSPLSELEHPGADTRRWNQLLVHRVGDQPEYLQRCRAEQWRVARAGENHWHCPYASL